MHPEHMAAFLSQQTPSVQLPVPHSSPDMHGEEAVFFGRHCPIAQ
jgi:hypothetical protein